MVKLENRFEIISVQKVAFGSTIEIWVDKATGVNYIYRRDGYSGGLTVMLDAEGKPVVSKAGNVSKA